MEKYLNRELSWLEFNQRVMEESEDLDNPLLERLKFTSIVSSNLDEFFMIRVGSLWDQIKAGVTQPDPSGLTPRDQIAAIHRITHQLVEKQYRAYFTLLDELEEQGVVLLRFRELTEEQKRFADRYYQEVVYPVLTPIVVDQSRPFPLIQNKSLNTGLLLQNPRQKGKYLFATVQVPSVLPRYLEVPALDGTRAFILLEKIIKEHLEELFDSHEILAYGHYRITRNADLGYDEEEAEDLLATIQEALKMRKWGRVVRLEVQADMDDRLLEILQDHLEVDDEEVYRVVHSIDLTFLMRFIQDNRMPAHQYPPFEPHWPVRYKDREDLLRKIGKRDILLHHPYDSFRPVMDLVKQAARDPGVLAIKMTLYRLSGHSPIIEDLAAAAENGKQVTVLVELKARFDEENNIVWAKKLEKAGAHVIYGLVGLKTHCKLLLIVRQEKQKIRRYVHLSTGNYNDVTARLYVDLGLFTADPRIGEDATAVFNMLSGYSRLKGLNHLMVAPEHLKTRFLELVDREIENARAGLPSGIRIKVNSLIDEEVIDRLYEASGAGVSIDLLVRGICGLRPGIPGLSENIRVYSIVGRFLEHSRIFRFENAGNPEIFLASADLMRRNLERRVEIMFPLLDERIRRQVDRILTAHFADTVKCRILQPDGSYIRNGSDGAFDSQQYFIENP